MNEHMHCPTCGQTADHRYLGQYRHGRASVAPACTAYGRWHRRVAAVRPDARPIRLRKRHVVAGFRNAVLCADTFHGPWYGIPMPTTPPSPPRGRLGHNPDLRAAKELLNRDLQGKHRR